MPCGHCSTAALVTRLLLDIYRAKVLLHEVFQKTGIGLTRIFGKKIDDYHRKRRQTAENGLGKNKCFVRNL